jgi:hypothetical protein
MMLTGFKFLSSQFAEAGGIGFELPMTLQAFDLYPNATIFQGYLQSKQPSGA